jgi:tetratricopeptide (TPR) repeat protein/predicted protein tyrosine phosphatase
MLNPPRQWNSREVHAVSAPRLNEREAEPPTPEGVRSFDELSARLRSLRSWAGVSYRELFRRVVRLRRSRGVAELPAYNTVYRCLQPGRARIDVELVVDVAQALLDDEVRAAQWRQAHRAASGVADDSAIVSATTALADDADGFCGREAELRQILDQTGSPDGPTAILIDGMAGVGKSRLAAHAARLLLDEGRFADLQLSVNLRAHDPEHAPADPAAVLDAFLRALGVPGRRIQSLRLAERTRLYRELINDRRALVMLDNAAGSDQVLPLLPDGPGCLTLVTSRSRLTGIRPARRVSLDVFTPDEALELLRHQTGQDRVDADPESASAIADCVGRLPLAIALVARRINTDPDWTLADQLHRLVERRQRLQLDDDVAIALGVSYEGLSPEQRRLLRRLALHPGRGCDAVGAAALVDVEPDVASRLMADLAAANLVQRSDSGRYELHDVVRVFAAGRARDEDPMRARRSALTRLLDQQRYLALQAASHYASYERPRLPDLDRPAVAVPTVVTDAESAKSWFDAERANLTAIAIYAAEHGWPEHCVHLSLMLSRYLDTNGHARDAVLLHDIARGICAPRVRGHVLSNLGTAHWRLGHHREAHACYQDALAAARADGDRAMQSRVLDNLGMSLRAIGRYVDALDHHRQSLAIKASGPGSDFLARTRNNLGVALRDLGRYDEALRQLEQIVSTSDGDVSTAGSAHNNIGLIRRELGDQVGALDNHRKALELARATGNRVTEGHSLDYLGCIHEVTGRARAAVRYHTRAIGILRDVGDRTGEGDALSHLGRALAQIGHPAFALACHERAVRIAQEIGHPECEMEALNDLGQSLCQDGQPRAASARHAQALAIARAVGHRYQQARALDGLGRSACDLGDPDAARTHWTAALALYRELGTAEAGLLARRLATTPTT